MTYAANREFKRIVATAVQPELASSGFTPLRGKPAWSRARGELVQIIAVQTLKPRKADQVEFGLNWSIGVPALNPLLWGRPDPADYYYDGIAAAGSAAALGIQSNRWWDVDETTSTDLLALGVREQTRALVRAIEKFDTRAALFKWLNEIAGPKAQLTFPPSEPRRLQVLAGLAVLLRNADAERLVNALDETSNIMPRVLRADPKLVRRLRAALS